MLVCGVVIGLFFVLVLFSSSLAAVKGFSMSGTLNVEELGSFLAFSYSSLCILFGAILLSLLELLRLCGFHGAFLWRFWHAKWMVMIGGVCWVVLCFCLKF